MVVSFFLIEIHASKYLIEVAYSVNLTVILWDGEILNVVCEGVGHLGWFFLFGTDFVTEERRRALKSLIRMLVNE